MTSKPWRRGLRLSVRATMLIVLVFAVLLGRQVDKARRQRAAVDAVRKHGGSVHFDYEFVNGKPAPGRGPWGPTWLRRRIGDEFFQEVVFVSFIHDFAAWKRFESLDGRSGDRMLALLSTQTGLKTLAMEGTQATDAGLAHLKGLTGLENLYLCNSTEISDAGLANLRGLVNLKNIHIDNSKVGDDGFAALAGMTKLESLVLDSHAFSDRGFSAVAGMKDLTWLRVGGSEERPSLITDESLALVAEMKNLNNLQLSYSRVTDKGLVHLKDLTNLEILYLNGCKVGDEGLRNLAEMKNLRSLHLADSDVSDAGLEHLRGLSKLTWLNLRGSKVTESGAKDLEKSLPSIVIDWNNAIP